MHTKGKLIVKDKWIQTESGHEVAYCGLPDMDEEDARRLVACWNACDGIATTTLEGKGCLTNLVNDISQQVDDARRERDELVDALRKALCVGKMRERIDAREQAESILAKYPQS